MRLSPPPPSGKITKTVAYYAVFVAFGLMVAALGPALPSLAAQTGTDLSRISMVFTARSLGFILGASLVGRVFDRLPGHPVLAVVLAVMVLVAFLVPLAPSLWLLVLLILLLGTSLGTLEVGANALLVWIHRHNLDPWMNGLHFAFGVGALSSPLIITWTLEATAGITWGFWTLALLILPLAGWLLWLSSPAIRGGASGSGHHLDRPDYRLVWPIALLFLLYVGAEASFGGWIYTFSLALHPEAKTMAGYLTSVFWGAITVGRLLAIPISTRLTPRRMLWLDFWGCLISIALILVWPGSLVAVWAGTLGAGLFMASVFPTLLNFAERRMDISGQVSGWFFAGGGLGGMTVPWLIGQFFATAGPLSTMVIILICILLALIVFGGMLYVMQVRSYKTAVKKV
jgi:FHS family Na+ dependent glucose MFS transporter 1